MPKVDFKIGESNEHYYRITVNKYLRTGLLGGFLCFMLSGCMIYNITKGNLPSDYRFPPNTQEGIAALTISCNVSESSMTSLSFYRVPFSYSQTLINHQILFVCNSPGNVLSEPELKLINLPAGVYYFNHFFQYFGSYTINSNFQPVYFKVDPGKVNYLGWLQLEAGYNGLYTVKVKDGTVSDIPWIKNKLPLLKDQDIQIKPLSFAVIK